MLFQSSVNLN